MKLKLYFIFLALCLLFLIAESNALEPIVINSVLPSSDVVKKHEKIELTVDFKTEYKNPFDPDDVDLSAVFISPSKKEFKIPGFLYSGEVSSDGVSQPLWKIRFTPAEEGEWRYYVMVKNKRGSAKSDVRKFNCTLSNDKGFIRVSKSDPYYFEYTDGAFFYPIGFNVCWALGATTYRYEEYYKAIAENGGNWSRLWMCSWGVALEWKKDKAYGGLRVYNLKNAKKIDEILELAKEYGIHIQLVINNHGQLSIATNAEWKDNPYNAKNGGPCQRPDEFFTNSEAIRFFKNRLRYIIARWGYSPNIFAWELWNEVDLTDYFNEGKVERWHKEMIDFINEIDLYGHMITTSYAKPLDYNLWKAPEISYSQVHLFSDTLIEETIFWAKEFKKRYNKPALIAEVASTAREGTIERSEDPNGIRFHNALWSSFLSSASGTAMYWWWDSYIKGNNLYYHLKPIANFISNEERRNKKLEELKYEVLNPKGVYGTLSFTPFLDWQPSTSSEFVVGNDGRISNIEGLSRFFQGQGHPEMKVTPIFNVDYPKDGYFVVNVDMISQFGAEIEIWLDDEIKSKSPFEPSMSYQRVDESFTIEMPAGKHRIKIENKGPDWFRVRNITLKNYALPLMIKGLQDETEAYVWFKNREDTVDNYKAQTKCFPIENPKVQLIGLKNGKYKIEYYDTVLGKTIQVQEGTCSNNVLILSPPTFLTDLACKVKLIP
ncbi:MAG: hypothetical protein AMJ78_07415 [Omnitrophica WOR_2 bacterium SM23_29]|nr:MAG: hypothetical protein AMJ78_07415 [Omnitrophica WOR_2 bacterium SM23_29]